MVHSMFQFSTLTTALKVRRRWQCHQVAKEFKVYAAIEGANPSLKRNN